nr:hypothetical protein [Paenibacillus ginsengarvi]
MKQVTLMSINVGEDIGLEIHPTLDQFLRIEEGQGPIYAPPNHPHGIVQETKPIAMAAE